MSDNSKPEPCSVCNGTGAPGPNDQKCVCQGEGTRDAEIKNLRAMAEALRGCFQEIQVRLGMMGYSCSKPSEIMAAIAKLHQRAVDAEEEFVKLKRQRIR
jgi:hypothetical protein